MFVVEIKKFHDFLRMISLAKTSKPFFDPIKIVFNKDHAFIGQMNDARTIAVFAKLDKSWFIDYSEGEITIPVSDILKNLKNLFKDATTLEIGLKENGRLYLRSSEEELELPAPDPSLVLDARDYVEKDYGLVLPKAVPEAGYLTRCDLLATIDTENIGFEWDKEKLYLKAVDEASGYKHTKKLPYTRMFGESSGSITVDGEIVRRIAKIYKTEPVWLLFLNEAPLTISFTGENYKISYAIVPVVET